MLLPTLAVLVQPWLKPELQKMLCISRKVEALLTTLPFALVEHAKALLAEVFLVLGFDEAAGLGIVVELLLL